MPNSNGDSPAQAERAERRAARQRSTDGGAVRRELVRDIRRWFRESARAEHTDTGEALALLRRARRALERMDR